jgi:uncharacterized LabA/DUF88 family protein
MDNLQSKDRTPDGTDGAVLLSAEEQEHNIEEIVNVEGATNHFQSLHQHLLPPAFAFLIDADNTGVESFPEIVKKAETLGIPTLRRAYGNQEALLGQKWKDLCLQYAVQPMAHLGISGVKNATDIALAVDAMDLFHTQAIRQFCLVTGDQDFTALVLRLRSYGCQVYGIGKPSKALAKVCTAFFPLEDLLESISGAKETPAKAPTLAKKTPTKASTPAKETPAKAPTPTKASTPAKKPPTEAPTPAKKTSGPSKTKANAAKKSVNDPDLTSLLTQAMTDVIRETNLEWILAARLGNHIKSLDLQFDTKTYGQKNLQSLCKARPDLFEWRTKGTHLEVRLK